jgi:hypothetical protein
VKCKKIIVLRVISLRIAGVDARGNFRDLEEGKRMKTAGSRYRRTLVKTAI